MEFCIKKVSTWFCFIHSAKESSLELPSCSLAQISFNIKRFEEIIHKLYLIYQTEFRTAWQYILSDARNQSFEMVMKIILSRCVYLSMAPSYLHFLLVCAFLHYLVEIFCKENFCSTFVLIASHCLIAVYDRCYKDFFDFGIFQSSCVDLNSKLAEASDSESARAGSPFKDQNLVTLMTDFRNINLDGFELTANEKQIVSEIIDRLPDPHSSLDSEESANEPEAEETSSREESVKNDSETDSLSSKDLSSESEDTSSKDELNPNPKPKPLPNRGFKTDAEFAKYRDRICKVCGIKCFEYAFSYVADVFREKES